MLSELTGAHDSGYVSRQSSDSDLSGTQQGWHDDLMMAMAAESSAQSRRAVTHITPFRDRIKTLAANTRRRHDYGDTFTPPTVTASTGPSIFDYSPVRPTQVRSSAEQPRTGDPPVHRERITSTGKKTWGEAIYKVGYERQVLDT